MENLIQPRILKGFRDFLPEAEITRATLIEKLTAVFRSFGYVPIDTPVMEYSEILLRKSNGETEKQVFRFEDNGGRDVALRFDLTVPFARFTAEHKDELYFPFKRYHIAKVWRGEKPQAGRYREFIQCDFDCVGSDSASSDFEILSLMKSALQAIGVEDITIRMSHRGIFNQFLEIRHLTDKSEDILRIVDKLAKVGKEEVTSQLETVTGSKTLAEEILEYITPADSFENTLAHMEAMAGGESDHTRRMRDIYAMMEATGIASSFVLDPSITRGLDYYTGIVYETFLNQLPGIGSVCSGGRYDNLAGLYMKEKVPGVGSSIGLDRLIAGLQQLNKLESRKSFIDAEIFCLDKAMMTEYQKLAQGFRQRGVCCEVFPDQKKILAQYTVAEKKGIPFGITLKSEGLSKGLVTVKALATREVFEDISLDEAVDILLKKN